MMASGWTMTVTGALMLLFSYNALRPHYRNAVVAVVSFFAGWLRSELALHALLFETLLVGLLVWNGALRTWPGGVGLLLHGVSMTLLLVSLQKSLGTGDVVAAALEDLPADEAPAKLPWPLLLFPFWTRDSKVEREANIIYYDEGDIRLKLDVYRRRGEDPRDPAQRRPALLFIHGGAWMVGSKSFQGLPMLRHFAALGWVCFSINYRLSPRATFPDHIVDVKRAIAWVRTHAAEYGCDPELHRRLR